MRAVIGHAMDSRACPAAISAAPVGGAYPAGEASRLVGVAGRTTARPLTLAGDPLTMPGSGQHEGDGHG